MNDPDGTDDGNGSPLNNARWTFDISGAVSLTSISFDIAAMGNFEASSSDGFRVEARVDGNAFQTIFAGTTDESANRNFRAFDVGTLVNLVDRLELSIDGVATGNFLDKSDAATSAFDTFTSLLLAGQSGSTLDIRISWMGTTSGGEPMGFDNFTINGTVIPEPGAAGLLAVASLGLMAGRRRQRVA